MGTLKVQIIPIKWFKGQNGYLRTFIHRQVSHLNPEYKCVSCFERILKGMSEPCQINISLLDLAVQYVLKYINPVCQCSNTAL